jgi:hypothetical protein
MVWHLAQSKYPDIILPGHKAINGEVNQTVTEGVE